MSDLTLCHISDLPAEGEMKRIVNGTWAFCIAKQDGEIFVLDDTCTHDRKTSLSEGRLYHGCIRCPKHGWAFGLKTGAVPHLPSHKLRVHPVVIDSNQVKLVNFSMTAILTTPDCEGPAASV